ncbi:MAG: hypothetical protein ACRCYF_19490, partial [Shewanella sp.]
MIQLLFKCQQKSVLISAFDFVFSKIILKMQLLSVSHTLKSIMSFFISCLVVVAAGLFSASSIADDTELYVFEASARNGSRPQVLIIFDNSGSMSSLAYGVDAPYE